MRGSDPAEAAGRYHQALTIAQRLAAADPGNLDYQQLLAWVRGRLEELDAH